MLKRSFDVVTAFTGLLIFSPILLAVTLAIWLQDYGSPFYIAPRAARGGGFFEMIKFRSMVVNADKIGGSWSQMASVTAKRIGEKIKRPVKASTTSKDLLSIKRKQGPRS